MGPSRTNLSAIGLVPPANAHWLEHERGSLAYWELGRGVYLTEVRGYMTRDMARLIIDRAEPLYAGGGKVIGIHNWLAMDNYESSCRVDLTAWVLRHRNQSTLHIGVASRLVAMGVAVANLALGSLIEVHADARALEKARRLVLGGSG